MHNACVVFIYISQQSNYVKIKLALADVTGTEVTLGCKHVNESFMMHRMQSKPTLTIQTQTKILNSRLQAKLYKMQGGLDTQ